jgi:anti-sigma regulatory factor (Ser/Thr protein kinase)
LTEAVRLAVTEVSQVGEARRVAVTLARQVGFDETEAGKVAIVVTEVGTNLVKHASGGVILLRPLAAEASTGVEVLALDRGPGMADVGRCLRDGFSSAGSPGHGLGAIRRLSAFADVYSTPGTGTVLLARLWARMPSTGPSGRFGLGAVSVPQRGESMCGDAWAATQDGGRLLLLVADGLGHGPEAAEAARAAVRVFSDNPGLRPASALQAVHGALHSTRGAAVAVAEADLDARVVLYAGVGNIAASVLANGVGRSMVSHNGTVGHEVRKFQEFSYPFPPGAMLVMHSDGLHSRWNLDPYPGLVQRDPALVAGVLYRDFERGRDDVTIVAARESEVGT